MNNFSDKHAMRTIVRSGFADCDIWRNALGNKERLFAFSIDGSLDAPENIPAGAMRYNVNQMIVARYEFK